MASMATQRSRPGWSPAASLEGTYDPRTIYRDEVDSAPPILDELILIAPGADAAALTKAAERGIVIAEGANVARTLSNRASNDVSPAVLADEARAIAEQHGLWIDVIDADKATEMGMGMFMAVGRGSDNPPRMIVMRSGGEGERDALGRHLAIVGKGVCFDSGGISIKPSGRMEEMKMDKTGACTVISAIATVARLAPGTPLLAVAPAVENMPGPHSTRPGDIVTALNGKKVDITNTDAEGRLILGDALTYAERLGATHLVDVATLTGAVSRALGHLVTGAFGTPQDFYDDGRGRRRPGRRALLAAPADRRLRARDGQLVRRPPELRLARGLAGQERPVHPRVRDQAVGPPRHRGDRLLPQAPAVRAARGDRRLARHARRARAGRRQGRLTTWNLSPHVLGAAGFVLGLASDRLATRWPDHDEEELPAGRAVDWRTAVCALVGAVGLGLLPLRFGSDPLAFALFGAWFVTLIIGLATDLDQRLLPDLLTLPVIPVAAIYAWSGANPLVGTELIPAVAGRGRHPGRPVPAVHPVRCRGVRDRRRQAAGRCRADGRRGGGARERGLRARAVGRRHRGAAGDPPDRAADVHPVRPVLHHRRAVGGPDPELTGYPQGPRRFRDHQPLCG